MPALLCHLLFLWWWIFHLPRCPRKLDHYSISDATYYNRKAKFGGMTVSDAQRLKALEAENAKLKRLLAESMLDNAALKDVID